MDDEWQMAPAGSAGGEWAFAARHAAIGRLLGMAWLLFLLLPVIGWLQMRPGPGRVALTLAGMITFVATYLWVLFRAMFPIPATQALSSRSRWLALAVLVGLALALTLAHGGPWFWLFALASGTAGGILAPSAALRAIAAIAVLVAAVACAQGLGVSAATALVLQTGLMGVGALGVIRLVRINLELRAAREDLARLAVAEERLRFARDLHDLLGHSLSLIVLKSELAGRLLPGMPERAATEIRDVEHAAREALREVRAAVAGYRQPVLADELAGAREMLAAAGIACRIEKTAGTLPAATDAVLAWAVREGVTNVIRHSRAPHCTIRLGQEAGAVCVEVTDDGHGGDGRARPTETRTGGSGLSGLAERVTAQGGHWTAGPLEGGGFRLRVTLPVPTGGRKSARADAEVRW